MSIVKGEGKSVLYELKHYRNVLMEIGKGSSLNGGVNTMFVYRIKNIEEVRNSNIMNIRKKYDISSSGYKLVYEILNAILYNNVVSELAQMYILTELSVEKVASCYYGYLRSLSKENEVKYNEKGDKSRAISQYRRDVDKITKIFNGKLNIVEQCLKGTISDKEVDIYIDNITEIELKKSNGMSEYNSKMVIPFKIYPIVNELEQKEFDKFMRILETNSRKAIEIKTKGLNNKYIGYFEYLVTRKDRTEEEDERLMMIRDILGM